MKREAASCHVTAIDWGAWDGGMVTPELRELFQSRGVALLDPVAGAAAFVDSFRRRHVDEVCVLVGPAQSLAGQRTGATAGFATRRQLAGVAGHPVIQAHRVGDFEVLPATFGLGLLVNVVERAHPGQVVVEVWDFAVHKGIVFDGTPLAPCPVRVEPASLDEAGRALVRASVRGGDGGRLPVSHYVATLVLAPTPPDPPRVADWPNHLRGAQRDGLAIYESGTQFHGPRLQGMRRVLVDDGERLVLECRLDDDPALRSAFGGAFHSPVLADVLLQGPPVLGKALLGQACLPLGVRRAEYFGPLPDGSPYFLVVDGAVVDEGGTGATARATACDADGVVLQRFTGVAVVATPDLSAKFAQSVRHWRAAANDE